MLDQLLAPNVGTQLEPRLLPSPLDLAAAFGSDFAYAIQRDAGETAYAHYDDQMTAMRDAIAARPDEAWGSTVYDAWLSAIEPMWLPHGTAFPDFMRGRRLEGQGPADRLRLVRGAEARHDPVHQAGRGRDGWRRSGQDAPELGGA